MNTFGSINVLQPRIALFAGSFDPFTSGHEDIVRRGLELFDEVVVGIGINPDKHPFMRTEARKQWIKAVFAGEPRVKVIAYDGLTVDAAQQCGAQFLLRGVRSAADFEYEQAVAQVNRDKAGIETVLLNTLPHLADISSTRLRHTINHGGDLTPYLPTNAPIHLLPIPTCG